MSANWNPNIKTKDTWLLRFLPKLKLVKFEIVTVRHPQGPLSQAIYYCKRG